MTKISTMPVSKAMYGMSKSGMEALKINFDALQLLYCLLYESKTNIKGPV